MYNTSSPSQDAAWRQAIDDELVTIDTTTESYASPQAAVRALIDWHCAVQIDPLVSSAAQALIDQGKREAQQAAQPAAQAVAPDPSERLVLGQAQHLIGALMAHGLLRSSLPEDDYLKLWDVVKRHLRLVNKEGARAALEQTK